MSAVGTLSEIYFDWSRLSLPFTLRSRVHFRRRSSPVQARIGKFGTFHFRTLGTDAAIIRKVLRDNEYGTETTAFFRALRLHYESILSSGRSPLIIDAGANIGAASVFFSTAFPLATVIAIEPDAANASVCQLNAGPNVEVIRAAIGSHGGRVALTDPGTGSDSFRTTRAPDQSGPNVAVLTVQNVVEAHKEACELFVVKVDIEGFEADLFSDNLEWLGEVKGLFIEPHDWMLPGEGSSRTFQRAMGDSGFEIAISGENIVYTRPISRNSTVVAP